MLSSSGCVAAVQRCPNTSHLWRISYPIKLAAILSTAFVPTAIVSLAGSKRGAILAGIGLTAVGLASIGGQYINCRIIAQQSFRSQKFMLELDGSDLSVRVCSWGRATFSWFPTIRESSSIPAML